MHLDHYVHPEFGFLFPTPRLRRELRMAFFSVLFGIGIGAAAVLALSRNNNADDGPVSRGVSSASVISEQAAEAVLGDNNPQAASIANEVNKADTSKPDGSTTDANSESNKTDAQTTCGDNNSACRNLPPAGKPRGKEMPAANDALAIGRAPIGRPDASLAPMPATPSASSERALEHSTGDRSEDRAGDPPDSKHLTHKKRYKTARNPHRPRQDAPNYRENRAASWNGRGYDSPVRALGRAYSLDRSFGQRSFWDWSR
jgi:hypothetical protein